MKNNRNISRVIALLLVLAMLLPSVSMTVFSADTPCAEDGCSGKYRNGICSVAGHLEAAPVEGGVYQICNAGQLFWFAALVNSGDNEYDGDNGDAYDAVLTADITLDGEQAWTPIGLYTSGREFIRYSGTFDGAGHTIYGLTYDNTKFDGRNAGLFGTVDSNGVVKNLTLAESSINGATDIGGIVSHNYGDVIGCTQSGSVTGTGATGGIVCRNMGLVLNCVNTGVVTGATTGGIAAENSGEIVSCDNAGSISGTSSVGGIVGMNEGAVEDSLNTAAVDATGTHVGGVVGNHLGGEIVGSGNTGAVTGGSDYIGGVAGACLGAAITESFNEGNVTGAASSEAVGGVVGAIDGTNLDKSVITSCYNTGKLSGRSWVGGIAGVSGYQKTPQTVEFSNGYSTGAVTGSSNTGAVVGKLSKGTVSGFYYLQGSQSSVNGATAATAEQFASGEIAAELNETANVWYQALDLEGIEPDASPVLDPEHGVVYEGYANCTELGYTNRENYDEPGDHVDADGDNVCDKCGHVEGEVHEHVFGDEWTVTKEPTCSETGMQERTCSECGWTQKREIPTAPHTEEIIPGTPATFDETGTTDGVKCSVCGEILVQQGVAPVLDYNEGIVPLNTLIVSCGDYETSGGASEGPAELAVDDDLNTIWHTDWYGTSRDNHWIQFELTEDYVVDGLRYKPRITGNTNGIITQYDIQISDDGVSFESVAAGSWAGDRNWKVAQFDGVQPKYVRLVALNAETDNAYVFACAAEIRLTGVKGGEQPHEHSYTAVVTEPTCTEGGYTTYTCECGDSYVADETPALGHTEEIIPGKDATCTEPGLTEGKKCSVCGEILVAQEEIPALGHTAAEPVIENEKAATCTEDGSYDSVVYCAVCGEEISRETVTVPAVGHTEEIIPGKDATCTETGLTEGKKCAVCDEILVAQEEIPALGHDWKGTSCQRCDATRENPFTDVPEDSFYIDPVLWAVEKGITTGATETTFNPNGVCQRAAVVTFLWRAAGSPEPTSTNNPFVDVKETDFFYKAVLWAVENEITNGLTTTT
ncbi:MAG: hypothetical protein E7451_06910, partial [Ruminococcaceae bacterium]|nr:hypothetical protein [Oscillospiraceae bacterium]